MNLPLLVFSFCRFNLPHRALTYTECVTTSKHTIKQSLGWQFTCFVKKWVHSNEDGGVDGRVFIRRISRHENASRRHDFVHKRKTSCTESEQSYTNNGVANRTGSRNIPRNTDRQNDSNEPGFTDETAWVKRKCTDYCQMKINSKSLNRTNERSVCTPHTDITGSWFTLTCGFLRNQVKHVTDTVCEITWR